MRRFALVCCAVLLTHGLVAADRTASAATITSITYDITGGDFGILYPFYTGPITGVSVTYTPPGGSVSTPFACSGLSNCGRLDFVVTGPSIMLTSYYTQWYYSLHSVMIDPSHFAGRFSYFGSVYGLVIGTIHATSGAGTGHSGNSPTVTASALVYTIGNEIRLPEPSTNVGLASGLLLLGALAALHTRKRARLY